MVLLKFLLGLIIGLSVFFGLGIITSDWSWYTLLVVTVIATLAGILYELGEDCLVRWFNP